MSWVIRNKETGEAIMETFLQSVVDKINTAKYEAVPVLQHLQELNQSIKETEITDADYLVEITDASYPEVIKH